MAAVCDAHEVLLSAMQRPNELGFVFKWKSLLLALKHWGTVAAGDAAAVDKLEALVFAMEGAGLRLDGRAAYVLVRAYVNSGQLQRVDGVLAWFKERGITRFKPAMLKLLVDAGLEGPAVAEAAVDAVSADSTAEEDQDADDDDELNSEAVGQ